MQTSNIQTSSSSGFISDINDQYPVVSWTFDRIFNLFNCAISALTSLGKTIGTVICYPQTNKNAPAQLIQQWNVSDPATAKKVFKSHRAEGYFRESSALQFKDLIADEQIGDEIAFCNKAGTKAYRAVFSHIFSHEKLAERLNDIRDFSDDYVFDLEDLTQLDPKSINTLSKQFGLYCYFELIVGYTGPFSDIGKLYQNGMENREWTEDDRDIVKKIYANSNGILIQRMQARGHTPAQIQALIVGVMDAVARGSAVVAEQIVSRLAQNSDLQEKLYTEIRDLDATQTSQCKLLSQVILEALRLQCPVQNVHRTTDTSVESGVFSGKPNSVLLEQGDKISIAIDVMTVKEDVVGPAPLTFNPDRKIVVETGDFWPGMPGLLFGHGTHICPGAPFFKAIITQLTASLVCGYRFEMDPAAKTSRWNVCLDQVSVHPRVQ
ncbi:MAG: cytochrome P450 [Chlamydiales bacterium]|nr:cytochrome P450 [Chlamydiales bacterium]